MNSDTNVDVSIKFCILLCHIIGGLLQNISIPVMDILVVFSPVSIVSKKQWVDTDLSLGVDISKGIVSQASG